MSSNMILCLKNILGTDFKFYPKIKRKKTMKIKIIFYKIMEFLDIETIFEMNYVCKDFSTKIKQNIYLENKLLKYQLSLAREIIDHLNGSNTVTKLGKFPNNLQNFSRKKQIVVCV